jgi:phosphohistidine phosphatase
MAMSRTIVLVRHAKSAWGLDVDDHERPLSKRGRRDGVAVGELLVERGIAADLVWCSTAVRARQTWERMVKGGAESGDVRYDDHLYEAVAHQLTKLLRKTPDDVRTVLMIGHSPGIPDLVERLAPRKGQRDLWNRMDTKFPTSALATLSYAGRWAELSKQSAALLSFDVPRGKAPTT